MTPPNAGDLKERLRHPMWMSMHIKPAPLMLEAADHIESLETDLGGTAMAFEQYRNVTTDEMEALKSQLAEARMALEAAYAYIDEAYDGAEEDAIAIKRKISTALQPKDPL